jgi:segregation and condensation protein A
MIEPVAPSVVFGEDRRPEVATQVRLDAFEGPLALLLALIEARHLDVMTVPLGALAEAYLDALAGLETDRLGNVSGFVAVAGQLILIKSRAMLPRRPDLAAASPEEAPDPEAALRARLIVYRAHRDAGTRLQAEALERVGLFRREPAAAAAAGRAGAQPAPAAPIDPWLLARALERMLRVVPPPPPPPETIPRTITIGQRAELIRAALRDADRVVLQELLRGVRDRVVMVVTFLALLELVKRREIVVEQAQPWGPIVARATSTEERAAAGGVAVDAPIDESLESFA